MTSIIMTSSGTRAIIGKNFNPTLAVNTAMAYGQFLGAGPVVVGGDTRVSYQMVKHALLSGFQAVGIDVIDIGQCLTPTLQQMIRHHQAKGGIMITASHNPIQWNGLKLMNASGSFLNQNEFNQFKLLYDAPEKIVLQPWNKLGTITEDLQAVKRHIDLILSKIDTTPIRQSNLKVIVDANNGAGAIGNPILLEKLGVEYTLMNKEPNGQFSHHPEPLIQNLNDLLTEMKTGKYDIGFAQDADADRLIIIDETGRFIGEDYSLAFCVDYILSQTPERPKKVVVNLSTSNVLRDIAKKHGASISHTKIGETNVTQGLKEEKATVGGEGNGGVIYPKVGWGRDSLVGITIALLHLAHTQKKVSEIVSHYPRYFMLRDQFEVENRDQVSVFLDKVESLFSGEKIDYTDGRKIILQNAWVHVRPSNTEPIVRIFVEALSKEEAKYLLEKTRKLVN